MGDNIPQPQVMSIRDALRLADEMELDLIEISPKAEPPVCRIADYQKFLYQQKKKAKELKANQTKVVVKEIRFGPQTDDHDYNFKLKHAQNFLKEGSKVKAYAALCHGPRRVRQGGDDAEARRQEDEHDARAQSQEIATRRGQSECRRHKCENNDCGADVSGPRVVVFAFTGDGTDASGRVSFQFFHYLWGRYAPFRSRNLLPNRTRFGFGIVRFFW